MKITLLGEEAIRLEPTPGPMTIEAASRDQLYSPFHMLASGLAFCTFSVLASWASTAKLTFEDIVVDVSWEFAEEPHRVGSIAMKVAWPSLPDRRRTAAARVAELCAIHGTLMHPPEVSTIVTGGDEAPTVAVTPAGPA